jgi:hypothetical protein
MRREGERDIQKDDLEVLCLGEGDMVEVIDISQKRGATTNMKGG